MTNLHLKDLLIKTVPNQLPSKEIYDRVQETEIKKPETAISGDFEKLGDSEIKPRLNGIRHTPILAESPNFRKDIGVSMSVEFLEEGFVKLPRALLTSEEWKNLTFRHKGLFLYLLEKVQYKFKVYNHHGKDIVIAPGQYCITYRRLVDEYNQSLKFKKEHIDVPFLQRAVSLYDKFRWTDTRSDTGIMVITITHRELCEHFKSLTDTGSDTKTIQDRYTNEERKKGRSMKETIDRADAPDRSSLLNKKEEEEQKQPTPSIFDVAPTPESNELSEEKRKIIPELWKFAVSKRVTEGNTACPKPGIKERDLVSWLKLYEAQDIAEAIKIASDKQIQRTYGGYITKLLQGRVPKKKGNIQINDEFLNELMKTHRLTHLENHKQYVTDTLKHTDYQKNTDPKMFKEMIMRSLEMASNYDDKPRENSDREYDDYEDDY
ncbi:MAG: hypothetical protein PHS86_01930 [Syntrophaceae bacterium]|nr:hypothetical protein [Syntrophaceae bacterium]